MAEVSYLPTLLLREGQTRVVDGDRSVAAPRPVGKADGWADSVGRAKAYPERGQGRRCHGPRSGHCGAPAIPDLESPESGVSGRAQRALYEHLGRLLGQVARNLSPFGARHLGQSGRAPGLANPLLGLLASPGAALDPA